MDGVSRIGRAALPKVMVGLGVACGARAMRASTAFDGLTGGPR